MMSKAERILCKVPGGRSIWNLYLAIWTVWLTFRDRLPSIDLSLKIMTRLKDGIFTFLYAGRTFRFWLPFAGDDIIQSTILSNGTFWDIDTLEHIRQYIPAGSAVIDCGANIGNHSIFFAAICKARSVLAFEPQKVCAEIFTRQAELNGLQGNIEIKCCALGSCMGKMSVGKYYPGNSGGTMFEYDEDGDVPVITLDSLNLQKLDFMKIDVEGAQLDVLNGAKETLSRLSPILLIELGTHVGETGFDKKKEINGPIKLLKELGYEVAERISPTDYVFAKQKLVG